MSAQQTATEPAVLPRSDRPLTDKPESTTDLAPAPDASRTDAIGSWMRNYWENHPKRSIETFGRQLQMGSDALGLLIVSIVRGRFNFREFVKSARFMAEVSVVPTMIVSVPVGVLVTVQIGALIDQIGALSFTGAAVGIGVLKQGAPLVTSMMIAGAVGSAICADLGSRTIREEVDAMRVMGVDPLSRLVAPRILASMVVSLLLCGIVVFVCFVATYVFFVFGQNGVSGSFITTFQTFADSNDLFLALFKSMLFGLLTAIIASDHGLNAKGGPAGVANAVNAALVQAALTLFAVNVLATQIYTQIVPSVLE